MKILLTFIAVLAASLSCHAAAFYQFNRWTTNVDGKLQDGSTITNLHDPTTVGTLNAGTVTVSGTASNMFQLNGTNGAMIIGVNPTNNTVKFSGTVVGIAGFSGIATNGGSGLGNSLTNTALNGATNFGPLTFLSGPADTNPQFITNANAQFYFGNIQGKADITAKNFTATGQFTGSGAGLVGVPNSALSANIARLDVLTQAFAGTNTFASVVVNDGDGTTSGLGFKDEPATGMIRVSGGPYLALQCQGGPGFTLNRFSDTAIAKLLVGSASGGSPDSSAQIEINSTSKGILLPRMTQAQRDAISSPTAGLIVYQNNTNKSIRVYDGSSWTYGVPYRAGTTNIGNLATSLLVTFTSPMSDVNYAVSLTFDSAVASAVSAAATSKTTNGFTISLSGGIAGGANLDYSAWPYQ